MRSRSYIDRSKITKTATDTRRDATNRTILLNFLLQIRNTRYRDFWQRHAYTGLDGARVLRMAQIMSSDDGTVQPLRVTRHGSTDYALFSSEVCSPSDPICTARRAQSIALAANNLHYKFKHTQLAIRQTHDAHEHISVYVLYIYITILVLNGETRIRK